jgi:hypothetical protein
MLSSKPSTFLTAEELKQIADKKFAEAEATAPGPHRDAMLQAAHNFRTTAEMKMWLSSAELQSPK